ncbi:hypothetical protein HYC85_012480 [Camellia sinensis]|uniref:Fe2OG dioxygenase domain-containing protein n=1 Tax=Camellia sinensis TaxID=4442 RepID=A0A7J7HD97_CAMSI|nr:hypothetical protein HYC85_012480 [Camellia sinensis]
MRLNNYPPCFRAHDTLGTGPHRDPNSLTILHQDNVGGLQVFVDQQWHSILPNSQAFVVNIGDTFMDDNFLVLNEKAKQGRSFLSRLAYCHPCFSHSKHL